MFAVQDNSTRSVIQAPVNRTPQKFSIIKSLNETTLWLFHTFHNLNTATAAQLA